MSKKENLLRQIRVYRRKWFRTPAEKLERKYDARLFELIGTEEYYKLYMLTPKQAQAKGII